MVVVAKNVAPVSDGLLINGDLSVVKERQIAQLDEGGQL